MRARREISIQPDRVYMRMAEAACSCRLKSNFKGPAATVCQWQCASVVHRYRSRVYREPPFNLAAWPCTGHSQHPTHHMHYTLPSPYRYPSTPLPLLPPTPYLLPPAPCPPTPYVLMVLAGQPGGWGLWRGGGGEERG